LFYSPKWQQWWLLMVENELKQSHRERGGLEKDSQ